MSACQNLAAWPYLESQNPGNRKAWQVFATMFNARTLHSQEVLDEVRATFRVPVFDHVVKQSVRFKEAPAGGVSILDYAPENDGAGAYRALARELLA